VLLAPRPVREARLEAGFGGKHELAGHAAQKAVAGIGRRIRMYTKQYDTLVDRRCGAGTTGEACLKLNRHAVLCDESQEWLDVTQKRITHCRHEVA